MLQEPKYMIIIEKMYGEDFTYADFAPMFKALSYDPEEWADLFEHSGAKYVVLTTKHHDGICLVAQ
ncbi:alpha-L-fucosidase [Bacteroides fragilis]|nr:alpha-L-fucosidase [Bacteroides fragilis]